MFKHTMASYNIIKGEISLLSYLANIISSVFMIGYLIFSSVTGGGILGVNITLAALTAINLATYLITKAKKSAESKKLRKFLKHCQIQLYHFLHNPNQ